jgi:CRP-like cAMP-binding protein
MSYRILVIEDNPDMLENIASILELGHYEVITAGNGKLGIEKALKEKPDLILCDVIMPDLDGYGVLHILGRNPETTTIPFVFLSGKTDTDHLREGMMLGADDYLTKPFDDTELLMVVEMRIKKHERIKASFDNKINDLKDFLNRAREVSGINTLSNHLPARKIKRKSFVYMEGHEPQNLFYIESGQIKTFMSTGDGKELIVGIHGIGEFIGYLPLLENTPYNESAVALEDSIVHMISKEDFNSLVFCNRIVATRFIKLLADNLFDVEHRLLEMAYQSVRQRVASALIKLYEKGKNSTNHASILTISRKDLSGLVGTATESLNRTLADFREEQLVELTESGIRIKNEKRLKKVIS